MTLPCGTISNIHPNVSSGVLILNLFHSELDDLHGITTDIYKMVHMPVRNNVLYLCVNYTLPLEDLKRIIDEFASINTQKFSVVFSGEGNQMLPLDYHRTLYYPAPYGELASFFTGSWIRTAELLKLFSNASELLLCTCQGSRLIDDVASMMKVGSVTMTLASGSLKMLGNVVDALDRTLASNDEFSVARVVAELSSYEPADRVMPAQYYNYAFHFDPVKITITQQGAVVDRYVEHDKALKECLYGFGSSTTAWQFVEYFLGIDAPYCKEMTPQEYLQGLVSVCEVFTVS